MKDKLLKKYIDTTYTNVLNNNFDYSKLTNKEYIKLSNSFFNENDDDLFIHSTFILDKDLFIHKVDKLNLYEKELAIINIFDNTSAFKEKLLFPLIEDFIRKNNIKSIEMIPNSKNISLYTLSIFAYNDNTLSVENISKTFARELTRIAKNVKPNTYKEENNLDKQGYTRLTVLFVITAIITILCGIILALEFI